MSIYEICIVIHVLGWVFWLGTDIGVLVGAKVSERADLGVEARLTVLQLAMVLDRAPRFAVSIVWFTGVVLSQQLGYEIIPVTIAAPLALIWLFFTWGVIFNEPTTRLFRFSAIGQTVLYIAAIIGMGAGASWLLYDGAMPLWMAIKWYGFVLVGIAAIALEKLFAPVGALFGELAVNGASDDLNSRISTSLKPGSP